MGGIEKDFCLFLLKGGQPPRCREDERVHLTARRCNVLSGPKRSISMQIADFGTRSSNEALFVSRRSRCNYSDDLHLWPKNTNYSKFILLLVLKLYECTVYSDE